MNEFDNLEKRLKPNRRGVIDKIAARMLSLEKMRLWFIALGVIGAFLTALAKAFDGTAGIVLLVVGPVLVAVGALFAARFDYRKLELTSSLTEAEDIAESAIAEGRKLLAERDALALETSELDRRRLALRQANDIMREVAEQAAVADVTALPAAAKFMLDGALIPIGTSIGFTQEERWAISVFQVHGEGEEAMLRRVTGIRAERLAEQENAREWRRNEGLVGVAWHTGRDAIIEDYRDARVEQQYPVPDDLRRPYDADRYRSMAAIPIRVGPQQTIWGVIAASSDETGRFKRDPENKKAQAVDTVRSISRATALLAAIFHSRG